MALSGDVKALIQANNGNVLAGTNNSARIYYSNDNGQTFTQIIALGSGADSVNAFAKVASTGVLLIAVSGSVTAQGIWQSLDNGASWTKVKSHPSSTGYLDVTAIQGGSKIVAVGHLTSFPNSPVIYSQNQGNTWADVSVSYYNQPHLAVSAYQEGILFTQYPGESYGAVFAFYGTDTYFTAQGGVNSGITGTASGFSTLGGGAGNGGLDMLSFLFKDGSGNYRRKALWAVKSHLDTSDTEIWQWPATPTGPYSFAKIATIQSENFRGLYVDPTPDANALDRTIWAGGNGTIYVSYNSGLTWAVATTEPAGQIYSFVRTSSGVLIAGGASGEIFLFSGTGGEGGGGGEEEPPVDAGIVTARFLGREATCDDEVYVANKFSFSNVTHIFYYNGSTYTNLQFATEPPYEFLGTTAAINRAAYFGSKTNDVNVPGGPFSSLVFDISQEAISVTIAWEYWNGASWATLTVEDNTSQFRNLGVNSVNWQSPTAWATTTVNSVTGYWVRARISGVASSPQLPIQANRYIYTALLPSIDIAASEVLGDLPAAGRIKWVNRSILDIKRAIYGLRKVDRGSNFSAFVNVSDVQTPFGLTVTKGTDAGVNWQTDVEAPSGRSLSVSYSAGPLNTWNDLAVITFSTSVARDYYGYYKAMLRCFYDNALAQAWNLRLQLRFGSGGSRVNTKSVYPTSLCQFEAIDFGQLSIFNRQVSSLAGSLADQMSIAIQGYCTSNAKEIILYDLILIPVDEWSADIQVPELITTGTPEVVNHSYLDIDSITNPKVSIAAANRNPAGLIVSQYQTVNNGPVIFQKEADQRLWFINLSYGSPFASYWRADPSAVGSVQLFKQQQYLGFRGRN